MAQALTRNAFRVRAWVTRLVQVHALGEELALFLSSIIKLGIVGRFLFL